MTAVAERAPTDAELAADEVVLSRLGAGALISGGAIPVHRMRSGKISGWDPLVPQVGWAFPVSANGADVTHLALVRFGDGFLSEVMSGEVADAGEGAPIGDALAMAAGMAACRPWPVRLRLLEVPGGTDAFWLEDSADSFVPLDMPRAQSGAEFVAELREAHEGYFADLMRAAEALEDAEDAAGN